MGIGKHFIKLNGSLVAIVFCGEFSFQISLFVCFSSEYQFFFFFFWILLFSFFPEYQFYSNVQCGRSRVLVSRYRWWKDLNKNEASKKFAKKHLRFFFSFFRFSFFPLSYKKIILLWKGLFKYDLFKLFLAFFVKVVFLSSI